MTQERHLGHAAEGARAVELRVKPRPGFAMMRMV